MKNLGNIAEIILRYGLALVIIWVGAMKFTTYEAEAIKGLVENSPFMSWNYQVFSVKTFSSILGASEIIIGLLIACRKFTPILCVVGSLAAALMFVGTLSFIISTPGWEATLGGFPALSVVPGQFLIKDLVLLGAALWSANEAYEAHNSK